MKKKYLLSSLLLFVLLLYNVSLYAQGQLWGMTRSGGSSGAGVIFKTNADGTGYLVQHDFYSPFPGESPVSDLLKASDGKLYGMTNRGGASDMGIIFQYDPATSAYTKKFDFSVANGAYPGGSLMQASNGKLYGMTPWGGANDQGVLFEYDPVANTYIKKIDFLSPVTGGQPQGGLVQAPNGKLYGMTAYIGASDYGVLFEYDPITSTYTKKIDFSPLNGWRCVGNLAVASSGKLYGLTASGGIYGGGVIFEFDPTTSLFTKKIDLSTTTGSSPYGTLLQATNGNLYALTSGGGTGEANKNGTLIEYNPVTNVLIKKFDFASSNGYQPRGNLIQLSNGKLYGLAFGGGANDQGVLFEYDLSSNTYTKKQDFSNPTGANPMGSLTQAPNGKLYGMSYRGGAADLGVLFEYDAALNTYIKKLDFSHAPNGSKPSSSALTQAANGKLYGLTSAGGANNLGVLFEIDPATNVYTKKIDLSSTLGSTPWAGMVTGADGKLYGVTLHGGANNNGVLFEYDPASNTYTKRVEFSPSIGISPAGKLLQLSNGKFYGTTGQGGTNNMGVIFEYDPVTYTYTKKIDLLRINGAFPRGVLTEASNGKFYGLCYGGGASEDGAIFEYDATTNTYTKKFDFTYATTGSGPSGSFLNATNGKLYATTYTGGVNESGVLFEYNPTTNTYTKKLDFQPSTGSNAFGELMQSSNGKIYATTMDGGANAVGVLYEYDPTTNTRVNKLTFAGINGAYPLYGSFLYINDVYVTTPANNAVNQNLSVSVSAKAVTGATTYTIELNDSPTFTGTPIVKSGSRTQSFSGLQYGTTYYTRVKTNLSPNWGIVTRFTTGSPEFFSYVTSPANGAIGTNVNLSVTANVITGASTYTIELNTASDFTGTSIVKSGARAQTFNNLAVSTTYYTRVKTDLSPNWGATRSFTTGSAVSLSYVTTPANNATNQLWTRTITANTITGASTYTIQLSPVNDFSTGIIQQTGSTPTLSFSGLAYDTQYFSRVTTDLSPGAWGPVRSFTTGNPANYSYITSPANGATNVSWIVTLTSNLVTDATQYTIEVNTASDFTGTSIVQTGSRSMNFTLAYSQLYYVRVKTNLMPAAWGPARSFTTGSPVSFAYVTSPANGATNVATTVNVSSNTVTGATSYTIELNTAPDFTGTATVKTSSSRTINFAGLSAGTTYYTRVSTNLSGGVWGATRSFTTTGTATGRIAQNTPDDITKETTEESFSIDVFGNPFTHSLSFIINARYQEEAAVKLIDLTGRVFHESNQKTNTLVVLEPSAAPGIYLLQAKTTSGLKYVRVMKIN